MLLLTEVLTSCWCCCSCHLVNSFWMCSDTEAMIISLDLWTASLQTQSNALQTPSQLHKSNNHQLKQSKTLLKLRNITDKYIKHHNETQNLILAITWNIQIFIKFIFVFICCVFCDFTPRICFWNYMLQNCHEPLLLFITMQASFELCCHVSI